MEGILLENLAENTLQTSNAKVVLGGRKLLERVPVYEASSAVLQ